MKLRTGRAIYKIPDHSQIFSVWIEGNMPHNQQVDFVLVQVAFGELPNNKEKLLGLLLVQ